jgi:hypothetical protein
MPYENYSLQNKVPLAIPEFYLHSRSGSGNLTFYQETFNPWLNLHRPCLFATAVVSPKGKIVKRYKHEDVKTPLECLAQLCEKDLVELNPEVTLQALQAQARSQTDLAATQAMQRAKGHLFDSFDKPKRRA